MPAGPLASLPGAPLAAFQPETAWTPPDHVTPAPAAACSTLVHADRLVLQQTLIIQEMPAQPQALVAVTGRRVFSCGGSKACTPDEWHCQCLWPVGVDTERQRQNSVHGANKAMASIRNMYELSEATKAAKSSACCKWDLNTHQEQV